MELKVTIGNLYGNTVVRPANQAAKILADIAGTKTLRVIDLARAAALGHSIVLDGSAGDKAAVATMIEGLNDTEKA